MSGTPAPLEAIASILTDAIDLYRGHPRATRTLRLQLDRLHEPLRIAVAGRRGTGKSTLVNALAGERIAPVRLGHRDSHLTWYRDEEKLQVTGQFRDGSQRDLTVSSSADGLWLTSPSIQQADLDRVLVACPARALRDLILIDTPSLADLGDGTADPIADRLATEADAVIYLARHPDAEEISGLRATTDSPIARAMPVNTVLVLSRADELAAGRVDALLEARQRARHAARTNSDCAPFQSVLAVTGLVAYAGRTLSAEQFGQLVTLAAVPRQELDRHLVSVDTFTEPRSPIPLTQDDRRTLLAHCGIYGIRLAVTLLRNGGDSRIKLAGQCAQHSGISELRDTIATYFLARRDTLKARSALLAIDSVLRAAPVPHADRVIEAVDQRVATMHEIRELRLLAALAAGRTPWSPSQRTEANRLLGGNGVTPLERLDAHDEQQAIVACLAAANVWRREAERESATEPSRHAARIVARTCEGLIAQLT